MCTYTDKSTRLIQPVGGNQVKARDMYMENGIVYFPDHFIISFHKSEFAIKIAT